MLKSILAEVRLEADGPDLFRTAAPTGVGSDAGSGAGSGAPCRPLHAEGPLVACVRERLAARAAQLGWGLAADGFAGLHLLVDGCRVDASLRGLSARFLVPAGARVVWLVSEAVALAESHGTPDHRALGVCVGRLVVDDGFDARVVAADDERLCVGFHDVERDAGTGPRRWTGGRARLPPELWAHCGDGFFLRLEMARLVLPRWTRAGRADHGRDAVAG